MTERRIPVKKIKAWIATLPEQYLECRARGYHVGVEFWVEDGERENSKVHLQHERCACGTQRTRGVNRVTGRFVGSFSYQHPEGYKAPEEIGWASVSGEARGLYRLERINRFYERRTAASRPKFSDGAR